MADTIDFSAYEEKPAASTPPKNADGSIDFSHYTDAAAPSSLPGGTARLAASGATSPTTQFEQDRAGAGEFHPIEAAKTTASDLWNMVKGAPASFLPTASPEVISRANELRKQGLSVPDAWKQASDEGRANATKQAAENNANRAAEGRSFPYRATAATLQTLGALDTRPMEEASNRGDVSAVVGHATAPAVAVVASPFLEKGISAGVDAVRPFPGWIKDATGRLVRDPAVLEYPKTPKSLRAPVKAVASVAKLAGGPEVLNAVLPAHPEAPQGPYAKLPVRVPKSVLAANAARAAEAAAPGAAAAAGSTPSVTVVPEPRAALPTERPGAMYSVPREQLPGLAAQRTPGAADVMRSTGNTVIFEPAGGTGFPGPRESVSMAQILRQRAAQAAAASQGEAIVPRETIPPAAPAQPAVQAAAPAIGDPASVAKYLRERATNNASGESMASKEAISRVASEKAGQIKRVRIDTRSGNEVPLIGVDAVDAKPGPYDVIIKRGPNGEEILDTGAKARPYKPKGARR